MQLGTETRKTVILMVAGAAISGLRQLNCLSILGSLDFFTLQNARSDRANLKNFLSGNSGYKA
jgi:hypothetical protein